MTCVGISKYLYKLTNVIVMYTCVFIQMNQRKMEGGWKGKRTMPLFLLTEQKDAVLIAGISPLKVLSGSATTLSVDEDHLVRS